MYIDLHCDTLMYCHQFKTGQDLIENTNRHLDVKSLLRAKVKGQFFAIYMLQPEDFHQMNRPIQKDKDYIYQCIEALDHACTLEPKLQRCYNYKEYIKHKKEGMISAFLTLEDGRYVTDEEKLMEMFHAGIRLITLTWNFPNALGYPNSKDPQIMGKGLTSWGRECVTKMNELGMIVDVSHLSDGGFWDVLKYSKKPVLASHSNARAITNHPRNLTDDMIEALAEKGGIAGLNYSPTFLNQENPKPGEAGRKSRVEDMIRHLKHLKKKGGKEFIALGTDFDGIGGDLEINRPEKYIYLVDKMKKEGFTSEEIDGFLYKNVERFLKETLPIHEERICK